MKHYLKKILLLLGIIKNEVGLGNFFVLSKSVATHQGMAHPIKKNNSNQIPLPGDSTLWEHPIKERAIKISELFSKNHPTLGLPSPEQILSQIITWSGFTGDSADIILYAYLFATYHNIELMDTYLSGSGMIDIKTQEIMPVGCFLNKFDAALAHGIKIFIFSEKQKEDVENGLTCLQANGFTQLINSLKIYYVKNLKELEETITKISKEKTIYSVIEKNQINEKIKVANIWPGGAYSAEHLKDKGIKIYIENKKKYGSVLTKQNWQVIIEDMKNKITADPNNYFQIVTQIGVLASNVKIHSLTEQYQLVKTTIKEYLKPIFDLDPFYKKYYESCIEKSSVTEIDIIAI
jgi:hypothetical protein